MKYQICNHRVHTQKSRAHQTVGDDNIYIYIYI